jgi:DnaD/phage-associated family protein
MTYYEKITGVIGGINYGALRLAIDMHGAESVKMAINKALEVNKTDMKYINGILKNWRREGYPNQREEIENGTRNIGKSNAADKNEFTKFKPKKPRNLTESERREAQEGLI